MDMKVQGSRSGKALGISELLASACSASATLDPVPGSIIDMDIVTVIRRRNRAQAAVNV